MAVLRLLQTAPKPLSHSEVVDALGNDEWDQATLYRNLIKLVEVDLARVASRVGGIARYERAGPDDAPHSHPHFACSECGSVECLPQMKISVGRDPKWRAAIEDAELQVVGQCPDCRRTPRGPRRAARVRP